MQPTDKVTLCTRSVLSHVSVQPPTKTYKLVFSKRMSFPFTVQLQKPTQDVGQQRVSLYHSHKVNACRSTTSGSGSPVCLHNTPWGNTENCVRWDVNRHQVGMTKLYTAISARTWPGRGKSGPERFFFFGEKVKSLFPENTCRFIRGPGSVFCLYI